ncbi:MAG: beta-1,6-N-acetylglucosaminyltransferase [Maribacter sp.]
MNLVVLVQAHKYPEQIDRMLRPFYAFDTIDIYVNIDSKTNIEPFEKILGQHVTFIENRVPIYWSNISQVQGMLNSFAEIKSKVYDYLIFMSGQDYVLSPVRQIISFLEKNSGKEFIEWEEISSKGLNWQVRYEKYHFTHLSPFRQKLGRLMRQLPLPKRRYPKFENLYGGGAWFMLTKSAIDYVSEFCIENPDFVHFHKYVHCPDEQFFQTILMNSSFKERIVNNNFWYIDWFSQSNNPKIIESAHFDRLVYSNKFFARKFDYKVDEKIMDLIDNHVAKNIKIDAL